MTVRTGGCQVRPTLARAACARHVTASVGSRLLARALRSPRRIGAARILFSISSRALISAQRDQVLRLVVSPCRCLRQRGHESSAQKAPPTNLPPGRRHARCWPLAAEELDLDGLRHGDQFEAVHGDNHRLMLRSRPRQPVRRRAAPRRPWWRPARLPGWPPPAGSCGPRLRCCRPAGPRSDA
jgi:hypothetical protein